MTIACRLSDLKEKVGKTALKFGRQPDDVNIVAVSKRHPQSVILEAYDSGQKIFGENRVSEALEKSIQIQYKDIEWHMIGHLQKNKVKVAADVFSHIHSLDSYELAFKLNRELENKEKVIKAFIQIKLSQEDAKTGLACSDIIKTAEKIRELPNIQVEGLMTMPPYSENPEDSAPYFRILRETLEQLNGSVFYDRKLKHLSMGMTGDYEVAIREGATYIRVGTMIFGERNYVHY